MSAVVHNLKKFFRRDFQEISTFKQPNFLNLQSERFIADLLSFAERTYLLKLLPPLKDHKVLFVSQLPHNDLSEKLLAQKPAFLMHYQRGEAKSSPNKRIHVMKGEMKPMPFKSGHFDCVLLPITTTPHFPLEIAFQEISRVLGNSGRFIFSIIHPALELLLKNQNPSVTSKANFMMQDYFKLLRNNSLFVEEISEVRVDKETKSFFMHEGERFFEEFSGFPLVLMVRAVRYVR